MYDRPYRLIRPALSADKAGLLFYLLLYRARGSEEQMGSYLCFNLHLALSDEKSHSASVGVLSAAE